METILNKLCDPQLVQDLRQLVKDGHTVPKLVATIQERLDLQDSNVLHCIVCFCSAFGIGIATAKPLGAWSGFPRGTWSDEKIDAEIMPAIWDNRATWDN